MIATIHYESKMAIVRDSIKEDCYEVAKRMRQQDREEVWASNHLSPLDATLESFRQSTSCLTVDRNGFSVAMFGIVPVNLLGRSASIWLLTTDGIIGIDKAFVRRSRHFIDYFLVFYPLLFSYCDIRNTVSMKWLTYLGCKWGDVVPYGYDRLPFRYFTFSKEK